MLTFSNLEKLSKNNMNIFIDQFGKENSRSLKNISCLKVQ